MSEDDHKIRKNLRLPEYDYAQAGAYFVTIVTTDRACLFGEIKQSELHLSPSGIISSNELPRLPQRFPAATLDAFVVMPNHIHAIIWIHEGRLVGARREKEINSARSPKASPAALNTYGSLSQIVGAYKSSVARMVNAIQHTPGAAIW